MGRLMGDGMRAWADSISQSSSLLSGLRAPFPGPGACCGLAIANEVVEGLIAEILLKLRPISRRLISLLESSRCRRSDPAGQVLLRRRPVLSPGGAYIWRMPGRQDQDGKGGPRPK